MMSDTAVPDDGSIYRAQVANATANLRDTAKWISSGIAVAAGGVIAGSALSGIGSVEPPWRLLLALFGAAIGLTALGTILWRSVDVLAARTLSLRSIVDDTIVPSKVRKQIEADLANMFPKALAGDPIRIPGFNELLARMDQIRTQLKDANDSVRSTAEADSRRINQALEFLVPAATFEELRHRFLKLKGAVFLGGAFVVIGFGVFAWAATPAKEEGLLKSPVATVVRVDPQDFPMLKKLWADASCATPELHVIKVRIRQSGQSDVVTVSPSATCPPLRLLLHEGRLFPAD